jgi:hypothetical protein
MSGRHLTPIDQLSRVTLPNRWQPVAAQSSSTSLNLHLDSRKAVMFAMRRGVAAIGVGAKEVTMGKTRFLLSVTILTLAAGAAEGITLPDTSSPCSTGSGAGCLSITNSDTTDYGAPAISATTQSPFGTAIVANGNYDGVDANGGNIGVNATGTNIGVVGYGSYGLYGYTSASSGYGVYGSNSSASGTGIYGTGFFGVVGQGNTSGDGIGVKGIGPNTYGVWGTSTSGIGVLGQGSTGVSGSTSNTSGYGVSGSNSSATGTGIYGSGFIGVVGQGNTSGDGIGVKGIGPNTYGVWGVSTSGTGVLGQGSTGVSGSTSSASGYGISGSNSSATGTGIYGSGFIGVVGQGNTSGDGIGVKGIGPNTYGVWGVSTSGYGVFGQSTTGYAGYFSGNVFSTATFSTNSWNSSDARLKKDVAGLTYGLKDVAALRPVTFKWKDQSRGDGRYIGFLAQDVQKVVPEVVTPEPKSGTLAVNYSGLIPVLVKSIQEQQVIITKQEARIQMLEQRPIVSSMFSGGINVSVAIGAFVVLMLNVIRRRKEQHKATGRQPAVS